MAQRDSFGYTVGAAAVLCVVCSLAVSLTAVGLKDKQDANKVLDQQRNILDATGLALGEFGVPASELSRDQVDELYKWISEELVNLEDGSINTEMDKAKYDAIELAGKKETQKVPDKSQYDIGEPYRETVSKVFFVKRPGDPTLRQVVLPVYGKGLWSTLRGYLALKSDFETIQGLTFYSHAETPGLGGEVDNPNWKAQWVGKKLFDESGQPAAEVFKGTAPKDDPSAVDGLSGATITSRGVTTLLRYWAGDDGYGPYLDNLKAKSADGGPVDSSAAGDKPADSSDKTEEGE